MVMTHTYAKTKVVKGQFVQRKQTDGQTDTTDRITFPTNAVGRNNITTLLAIAICQYDLSVMSGGLVY